MSFTLEIHFHCLFCYVPNPDEKKVHLLAPDTHHHHAHVARLVHYKPDTGCEIDKMWEMEGWELDLPGNGSEPTMTLPPEIINISKKSAKKLDKLLVGKVPGKKVVSRVNLVSGTATECMVDMFWLVDGKPVNLARGVVWTIENVPGNELIWSRTRLKEHVNDPDETEALPGLVPVEGLIRLDVFHVLKEDFPPPFKPRPPQSSAAHFKAYHPLFGLSSEELVPRVRPENPKSFTVGCASVQGELAP